MRRAATMVMVMLLTLTAHAQHGISYQAALRNAQGEPMANREVQLRLTLREGATDQYTETQSVTTSALGIINVVVGEGTAVSGQFDKLDWSRPYELVVEIDADGNGNYTQLQASALHPVPQAQWAKVASDLLMPDNRGVTLQPKATAPMHEDSVLFGVRNNKGELVFAVYNSGVAVYVDDRDNGARPNRAGFFVGGLDGTREGKQRTLFAVDGTGTQVHVDDETASRPNRAGFFVGGLDGTRAGEGTQRKLFAVDATGTKVHVDGRDPQARPQRAGFFVGGLDGTRASSSLLTVDSSGTNVFIDDANAPTGRPNRAGFFVGGLDGTRAGEGTQRNNYFVVTPDSTRVYVDDSNRPQRAGFAVGGLDGTRAGDSRYMDITKENYIIGHGAGKALMSGTATGKNNSIMGTDAGVALSNGSEDNVVLGTSAAQTAKKMVRTIAIGNAAGKGTASSTSTDDIFIGYQAGIANTTGKNNVFVGNQTGLANTTGESNVFVGNQAGAANTTASNNVFMGYYAGKANTTGASNVFVGNQAGAANVSGENNVVLGTNAAQTAKSMTRTIAIGNEAGKGTTNSTSIDDIFIGYQAGKANTTGASNVFVGNQAGAANTNGSNNVMMGNLAGLKNTSGASNVFVGNQAGAANTTGGNNIFIGTNAACSTQTSSSSIVMGNATANKVAINPLSKVVVIGNEALTDLKIPTNKTMICNIVIGDGAGKQLGGATGANVRDADYNVFIGYEAGYNMGIATSDATLKDVASNVAVGNSSGYSAKGYRNVFMGSSSGYNYDGLHSTMIGFHVGMDASGDYNVYLGDQAGLKSKGGQNTFLGRTAGCFSEGSGNIYIGNDVGGTYTAYLKENGVVRIGGSGKSNYIVATGTRVDLKGTVYANGTQLTSDKRLKTDIRPLENALAKVMKLNGVSYKWRSAEFKERGFDENRHAGVLAQEVEAVLPEAVSTGEDGFKSVSYSDIVPLLIEGMKELKAEKDELQTTVRKQQQQIDELKKLVEQLLKK